MRMSFKAVFLTQMLWTFTLALVAVVSCHNQCSGFQLMHWIGKYSHYFSLALCKTFFWLCASSLLCYFFNAFKDFYIFLVDLSGGLVVIIQPNVIKNSS